jgi:hypothetical protein
MSQAVRKPRTAAPAPAAEPAARASAARAATAADAAHASPALRLREHLEAQVGQAARPRWSHRRTLAFLVAVNGAFWLSVALLVSRFL